MLLNLPYFNALEMKTKKQDLLLKLIDQGHSIIINPENLKILYDLKNFGLISEITETSFKHTRYGILIKATGFKSHLQTEEFEKELPKYTPGRASFPSDKKM